jgi:hypothetical protein
MQKRKPSRPAKRVMRMRVTPQQYKQFMNETKKFSGDSVLLLQHLMKRYFGRDGDQ